MSDHLPEQQMMAAVVCSTTTTTPPLCRTCSWQRIGMLTHHESIKSCSLGVPVADSDTADTQQLLHEADLSHSDLNLPVQLHSAWSFTASLRCVQMWEIRLLWGCSEFLQAYCCTSYMTKQQTLSHLFTFSHWFYFLRLEEQCLNISQFKANMVIFPK